jgi:AcrR family transcriptional regulator
VAGREPETTGSDRSAALRRAVRRMVADHGFHGASMSLIAAEAGVATGTAYVHYPSKDELMLATYVECKQELARAMVAAIDASAAPAVRFAQMWRAAYRHLATEPARAAFLVQIDVSPYAAIAHQRAAASDEVLAAEASRPDMAALLAPLPLELLFDVAFGPAVRAAATGNAVDAATRQHLAVACWRAVTVPGDG